MKDGWNGCRSRLRWRTGSARTSSTITLAEFTRTGFTGGLNWYRNFDRNWELTNSNACCHHHRAVAVHHGLKGCRADVHSASDRATEVVTGEYEELVIDGAGHWVQQERPDEVNEALLKFLSGLEM